MLGGINVACHLESSACGRHDQETFRRIFFTHPWEWIVAKSKILPNYWFASVERFTVSSERSTQADVIINSVYLFLLVAEFYLN